MRFIHDYFRRPTIEQVRLQSLQQTEQELHDAQMLLEHYHHSVCMLQERHTRLRAALDNSRKEPQQ